MSGRRLVLAVAVIYPTALAWLYFVALTRQGESNLADVRTGVNPLVIAAWVGGKLVQFALPLLWLAFVEGRRLKLVAPSLRELSLGLALGLLVAVATWAIYSWLSAHTRLLAQAPAKVIGRVHEFGLETPARFLLFAGFLSVAHSFLEEYYWRWFVFARLRQEMPALAAGLLSSLAFMAFHVIDLAAFFPGKFWLLVVPLSLCVGIGGGIWCWLFHRTGSIYSPWISHLLIDAAIMVVGYDLVFNSP
jgi:membrane protease YdiL (CAAX protease family)